MKIRLRTHLILMMALLLTAALMIAGAYTSIRARSAVDALAEKILDEHLDLVDRQVESLLSEASNRSHVVGQLVTNDTVASADDVRYDNLRHFILTLQRLLATSDYIGYLSITSAEDGAFAQASRDSHGDIVLQLNRRLPSGLYLRRDYLWKNGDMVLIREDNAWKIDSRTRPYFQLAKAKGQQVWTNVYTFIASGAGQAEPGITCATPLYDSQGRLVAVATADLSLRGMSQFLNRVRFGENGYAFIVDYSVSSDGELIAHPDPKMVISMNSADSLVHVDSIRDKDAKAVLTTFAARKNRASTTIMARSGDKEIFASYRHLAYADVDWGIFALAPQSFFSQKVDEAKTLVMLVGSLLLCIGILLSAFLAWRISVPLQRLAEDAELIRDLQMRDMDIQTSSIKEVDNLASSFDVMKAGLRSFVKLVPMDYVRYLIQENKEATLGGERRNMTVLFGDMQGFTEMASVTPPDQVFERLTEFFELMSTEIQKQEGTIDKFIGDAVMAFWGAPTPVEDHAIRACTASLLGLRNLEKQTLAPNQSRMQARFGLETGEMIVGNLGTQSRMNYTVIGDTVNLGSRLQGLCKYYGASVLIGPGAAACIQDQFVIRPVDRVSVMGREEPVTVYELMDFAGEASPETSERARLAHEAFVAYQARDWAEATALYRALLELQSGDGAAKRLLDRARRFERNPPDEPWDGTFRPDFK